MADDNNHEVELGNEGLSFKEIALRQFSECSKSLSVELRGGYHYYAKSGEDGKEVYVPDTREIACNHIKVLAMLCLPKFDKVMSPKWTAFKSNLTKLQKKFMDKSSVEETIVLSSDHYNSESDKMLLEEFKCKRLDLCIKLFSDLSIFIEGKNYFEIGGGTF